MSYNGGPHGINARPSAQEQTALRETHINATTIQTNHLNQASANRAQYASVNHGQPATTAMTRPGVSVMHRNPITLVARIRSGPHPSDCSSAGTFSSTTARDNNNAEANRLPASIVVRNSILIRKHTTLKRNILSNLNSIRNNNRSLATCYNSIFNNNMRNSKYSMHLNRNNHMHAAPNNICSRRRNNIIQHTATTSPKPR